MWTFIMLPNCAVHVVMYAYYLCACLGPRMQGIVCVCVCVYLSRRQIRAIDPTDLRNISAPHRARGTKERRSVVRVCSHTRGLHCGSTALP